MVDTDELTDFQRSTRMPLDAVVRLHFEGTVAYQNGFAANVSASGMYVKHPEPPPVGTRLVFEFNIGAQRKPVQGAGEVVWSRDKYDGPGRPAGAGIRFVELDALSRQHLTEALFEFLEASLGDRVVESPEARALVASVPTHAPPEALSSIEPEVEPVPGPVSGPALPPPQLRVEDAGAGSPTPFRIFDEEPAPFVPAFAAEPAPAVPAPDPTARPLAPTYGAAMAHADAEDRGPWLLATGVLVLLAAALAVWWFFWRTPPAAPPAPPPPSSAAPAAPARPAPPPLDARVAGDRTLVESVGGAVKVPETPLPPPGPAPAEPAEAAAPAAAAPAPATAPTAPAAAAATLATPAPPAVTAVRGIAAAASAGSTVVTISGDGAFALGGFSWSEIGGDKPRVLIKLKGIRETFRGAPSGVPTGQLQGIRVGYHPEIGSGELHVVLDLPAGARVAVAAIEPAGDRLVVTLTR